jgi:hypothetical protein
VIIDDSEKTNLLNRNPRTIEAPKTHTEITEGENGSSVLAKAKKSITA